MYITFLYKIFNLNKNYLFIPVCNFENTNEKISIENILNNTLTNRLYQSQTLTRINILKTFLLLFKYLVIFIFNR